MSRPAAATIGTIGLALAAGGMVGASQMDCSDEGLLDFCKPGRAGLIGMSAIIGVFGIVGVTHAITSDDAATATDGAQ